MEEWTAGRPSAISPAGGSWWRLYSRCTTVWPERIGATARVRAHTWNGALRSGEDFEWSGADS